MEFMTNCEYCRPVRDDNKELLENERDFVQIRYKDGTYYLYLTTLRRKINYCPMCGREL